MIYDAGLLGNNVFTYVLYFSQNDVTYNYIIFSLSGGVLEKKSAGSYVQLLRSNLFFQEAQSIKHFSNLADVLFGNASYQVIDEKIGDIQKVYPGILNQAVFSVTTDWFVSFGDLAQTVSIPYVVLAAGVGVDDSILIVNDHPPYSWAECRLSTDSGVTYNSLGLSLYYYATKIAMIYSSTNFALYGNFATEAAANELRIKRGSQWLTHTLYDVTQLIYVDSDTMLIVASNGTTTTIYKLIISTDTLTQIVQYTGALGNYCSCTINDQMLFVPGLQNLRIYSLDGTLLINIDLSDYITNINPRYHVAYKIF